MIGTGIAYSVRTASGGSVLVAVQGGKKELLNIPKPASTERTDGLGLEPILAPSSIYLLSIKCQLIA